MARAQIGGLRLFPLSTLRAHGRLLGFGFFMCLCSNFGQTFFISLFGGEVRAAFGFTHGGFGTIYSMATLVSAAFLLWAGRFVDRMSLAAFSAVVLGGLAGACLLFGRASGDAALFAAILFLRLFGQGLSGHTAITAMGRYFDSHRGRAVSIASLGHRIGLHFDATLDCAETLEARAGAEARYLSALAGAPVSMISFHRPEQIWINNAASLAGLPHTYQPRYFSEIGYCSDSRGGWWRGAPLHHDAVKSGTALQLLTHPAWWVDAGHSPTERLADHLERRRQKLASDLKANIVIPEVADND